MLKKIRQFLFEPKDSNIVSVYRIAFGLFMIYQMFYYFEIDYVYQFMSGPQMLFLYDSFEFIKPLSSSSLRYIQFGMLISAILITIGFLYRYAIIFFFLGFSYFFLIDTTIYNNHLYLICLLSFALMFMDADKKYSIKSILAKKEHSKLIPAWHQYLLIFLISLPYFYGGIAKLSYNWLGTDLPRIIMEYSKQDILFGLISKNATINFVTYSGIIFDLSIVFILLFKKTRLYGVLFVLLFNLTNHVVLFNDIGLFPFLMIFSTILFFKPEEVERFLNFLNRKKAPTNSKKISAKNSKIIGDQQLPILENKWTLKRKMLCIGLSLFVLFQLLFPLRHYLLTDNPEWTGIASRFAWRMKLQDKELINFRMSFTNRETYESRLIEAKTFLTNNQYKHLADDPLNFVHLARYLQSRIEQETNIINPEINATVELRFNGLPKQFLFDPKLDLLNVEEKKLKNGTWLYPLKKE